MNTDFIKMEIQKNLNQAVAITVYGMRNKINRYVGYISGVYPNIFTVNVEGENISFSYVDVITKELKIDYL